MLAAMTARERSTTPPTSDGDVERAPRCPECEHEQVGVKLRGLPVECAHAFDYGMGDIGTCGCESAVHSHRLVPDFVAA